MKAALKFIICHLVLMLLMNKLSNIKFS